MRALRGAMIAILVLFLGPVGPALAQGPPTQAAQPVAEAVELATASAPRVETKQPAAPAPRQAAQAPKPPEPVTRHVTEPVAKAV
jgi:hypothetical protein